VMQAITRLEQFLANAMRNFSMPFIMRARF